MSAYPPPKENLPIYNPTDFQEDNFPLTIQDARGFFLEYPIAQGEETLQATIINGQLTCNDVATINDSLDISQPTNTLNALNIEQDEPGYTIKATQKTGAGGQLLVSNSSSTGKSNVITQQGDCEIAGGINQTSGALTLVPASQQYGQGIRLAYDKNEIYGKTELKTGGSSVGPPIPAVITFPDGTEQPSASAYSFPTHWVQSNGNQFLMSMLDGSAGTATIQLPYAIQLTPTPAIGSYGITLTLEIKYNITYGTNYFNWLFASSSPSELVYSGYFLGTIFIQPFFQVVSGTTPQPQVINTITNIGNMFQSQTISSSGNVSKSNFTPITIDYGSQSSFDKLDIIFGDCETPIPPGQLVGLTSFTRSVRIVDNYSVNQIVSPAPGDMSKTTITLPNSNVAVNPSGAYFNPY